MLPKAHLIILSQDTVMRQMPLVVLKSILSPRPVWSHVVNILKLIVKQGAYRGLILT